MITKQQKQAISDGRAYLDTYIGQRRVRSYNPDTGDCVTNNTNDYYQQQTFMVCADSIKIEGEKC